MKRHFGVTKGREKYKWSLDEWKNHVFQHFKPEDQSSQLKHKDVLCIILLVFPTFGPTMKTKEGLKQLHPFIRDHLETADVEKYYLIFKNNSKKLIVAFFGDPLIRRLWDLVADSITEEDCQINKHR